jgi:hypothetical protein
MWHSVDPVKSNVSKERQLLQNPHYATSQKKASSKVTALKASNYTFYFYFFILFLISNQNVHSMS